MLEPALIDSHCHLQMIDYQSLRSDMESVIQTAHEAGVKQMLCVATDFSEHPELVRIANTFPNILISVGLHPNEAQHPHLKPDPASFIDMAMHPKVIALGETGLDYYRDTTNPNEQQAWFLAHIDAGKQLKKPLIIHTRMARTDTIDILKREQVRDIGGVLHCFTEDWDMAKQALDLGLYLSFSGIITFKNAEDLREVVKKTPLENLLIETDAPFLTPVPYRGKVNQPAYLKEIAKCVAELKGVSFETVAKQTSENFRKLFIT